MAIKKGLGRGLDMLIPQDNKFENEETNIEKDDKNVNEKNNYSIKETLIDINIIEPNRNQPRKQFDEDAIEELTDSIKQYGIIQPIVVRKKEEYYEIITGERRWRAAKRAGLQQVPVLVKEYEDKEVLKVSLIENLQREDLNPIEEAQAYQKLQKEYGLKQDEIAASVSKSRTAITNTMRLMKLDQRVQQMILNNLISGGHGRTLIPISDYDIQYQIACKILDESLSVRESERLVKRVLDNKDKKTVDDNKQNNENNEMIEFYENKMKDIFGCKVSIKNKKNNKGKIEIEYYSKDELESVLDKIQSIKL